MGAGFSYGAGLPHIAGQPAAGVHHGGKGVEGVFERAQSAEWRPAAGLTVGTPTAALRAVSIVDLGTQHGRHRCARLAPERAQGRRPVFSPPPPAGGGWGEGGRLNEVWLSTAKMRRPGPGRDLSAPSERSDAWTCQKFCV
ncbi:protein of unknown function [Cupriavidus taiwanensis]|uniref:Uncharacterized protein n=1 Tax=Cupriavidus taiwanensis TaxID=164546 RepID=A0A375IH28_9BURK|nr:protein of unknown function [Cupriavidus taiwanensis]